MPLHELVDLEEQVKALTISLRYLKLRLGIAVLFWGPSSELKCPHYRIQRREKR